MFKLIRKHHIGVLTVLVFTLLPTFSIALVTSRQEGAWPESWPKELEPYRKQARTIEVTTGAQENVYEIHFKNRGEFEKIWPVILKLKTKGAPLRLRSIEKPFKEHVSVFDNERPVLRIYSHVYPAHGTSRPGGKMLVPAPPWPESIKSPAGLLPEYVMSSEDSNTWVTAGEKKPKGFMFRARTEIELVVDGEVIDLNRIRLPGNASIIDKRILGTKPAVRLEGEKWKPQNLNADEVYEKALALAAKENKLVFLHFGAPWCGWCHRLEDFLARPEISRIMKTDYIIVKIDLDLMTGAKDLDKRIRQGKGGGIPWYAILDAKGKLLINSVGPRGNFGYPASPDAIAHFIYMLKKTAKNMSSEQILTIEKTLSSRYKH